MSSNLFFFIALSFILTHEMDAIRLKEWRLFLILQNLEEELAYRIFTGLHVPLYIALFVGLFGAGTGTINSTLVIALDIFFIIHVGLHILFLRHPDNPFRSWFSWLLIVGAGIAGAVDLVSQM